MVHKKLKHFLASFFLAFDWCNFLIAIQIRSFNFMDFESNSRSKKNLLTREAMNNGAKKMAHLLCTISSLGHLARCGYNFVVLQRLELEDFFSLL